MKKVLIIDDEEKIRNIYSNLLRESNFEVFEASNAVDAYDILKNQQIDLMLLDINMPDVDGSLLHELVDTFYKSVKVIVCSVFSLEEQQRWIRHAVDYYDKSQSLEILRVKIEKAFNLAVS